MTPDRSKEKTADVIYFNAGPLSDWIRTKRYNGIEKYVEEGFTGTRIQNKTYYLRHLRKRHLRFIVNTAIF